MTQFVLDATLANKLQELGHPVELCDPSGRVVGRFVPLTDVSEWEPVSPDVSEEELDRREQSTEWYTYEQVCDRLRQSGNV